MIASNAVTSRAPAESTDLATAPADCSAGFPRLMTAARFDRTMRRRSRIIGWACRVRHAKSPSTAACAAKLLTKTTSRHETRTRCTRRVAISIRFLGACSTGLQLASIPGRRFPYCKGPVRYFGLTQPGARALCRGDARNQTVRGPSVHCIGPIRDGFEAAGIRTVSRFQLLRVSFSAPH